MMKDWKEVSLGEVCKFNLRNLKKDFPYTEICYLDISSVGTGEAKFDNIININAAPSRAKRIPIKGDSIIATVRPGNRSFYYMKEIPPNTVVSTGFSILSPVENKLDNRFLYYIISNQQFTQYLISVEQGANYPAVTASDISDAKIFLPPLETQRKIASILSSYDDLIENNLKRIKLLEEKAQRTYEEWFVKMRFPGYETAVFDQVTGLPEGWGKVKCFDAMEVLSGGTPKTTIDEYWNGEIEFYTPKDACSTAYTNGTEKKVTKIGLEKCNSKLYPKNTVFITARGTVGKVNLASQNMAMNQSCYALKGKENITQLFLYNSIKSIVDSFKSAASGGVFDTIIVDTFKFLTFILPSKNLIIDFTELVTPIYESCLIIQSQNRLLKEARDILLPRLMSGMIDVEELELETSKK